jgi:hypothetical protein
MNELLGFAVLTGPLWLIILLLPVCIWIAIKIARRFKPGAARFTGGIGIFLFLFLLPFGDEIAGRIYLSHLCATEAGVKVHQTVELPAEYWDEQGKARFIKKEGSLEFDEAMLGYQFRRNSASQHRTDFFEINRDSYQLIDKKSQSIVGEDINFRFWGGWITRSFSPNQSAIGCSREQVGYFTDVLKKVFKPIRSK